MTRRDWGKVFIAVAALSTIVIPIGVDGVLLPQAHMQNPLWPPHAKLHCAMSFFAAIGLGIASLMTLWHRPVDDSPAMANAAFCATAFWFGLIASGFWPGASYNFEGDPANYVAPPMLLGLSINLNVVAAALSIVVGWIGWAMTKTDRRTASRRGSLEHTV